MTAETTPTSTAKYNAGDAIPMELFGKDHWSLFAYVETRCVDHDGILNRPHLSCNASRHPLQSHSGGWSPEFSSRLKGFFDEEHKDKSFAEKAEAGLVVMGSDDWDCLENLEQAGLLEIISMANMGVVMTKEGHRIAGLLREHKAGGNNFATFTPATPAPEVEAKVKKGMTP